jgi:hypothetical protein
VVQETNEEPAANGNSSSFTPRPSALYQGTTLVGPQRIKRDWASALPSRIQQKMLLEIIQAGAKAQIFVGLNSPD